jgi:hypothetical protein
MTATNQTSLEPRMVSAASDQGWLVTWITPTGVCVSFEARKARVSLGAHAARKGPKYLQKRRLRYQDIALTYLGKGWSLPTVREEVRLVTKFTCTS